ncbi:MAG TPA: mechanosensitive ion channel family protein [Terracidiphilus sp.]|jgi:small conductance mechanosensitive channel
MPFNLQSISQTTTAVITAVGLKIIGAILLFFVGRALIRFGTRLISSVLRRQNLDATLVSYASTSLSIILNVILVVAILGFFGVETTSFAALLAGVGLAVGAAWSGLLANFAAGIFLIVLRPFRVGDHIHAGGVEGAVQTIGLFTTILSTGDNTLIHLGNNKIFADNIQNFSTNSYRRVDLETQLADTVSPFVARELLMTVLPTIPNVLATPAPVVEIVRFNFAGPVLAVRPFCHDKDYWQVYFDANTAIAQAFAKAGYPMPAQNYALRSYPPAAMMAQPTPVAPPIASA